MTRRRKPKAMTVMRDVPDILIHHGDGPIRAGDVVSVSRVFWRNGEHWLQLVDGRQIPDVFTI